MTIRLKSDADFVFSSWLSVRASHEHIHHMPIANNGVESAKSHGISDSNRSYHLYYCTVGLPRMTGLLGVLTPGLERRERWRHVVTLEGVYGLCPSLRDARKRSSAAPATKRRARFTATTTWPQENFQRPPFCSTSLEKVQTRAVGLRPTGPHFYSLNPAAPPPDVRWGSAHRWRLDILARLWHTLPAPPSNATRAAFGTLWGSA